MALSDLTYENIMTIFANTTISCKDAHHTAKEIIALAERNHDLNTHEGRVNFAKDNADIRQHILDGYRVKAVKFMWDMRLTGDYYFSLKEAKDAVYEAYGLSY